MGVGEREIEMVRWFNSTFDRIDFVAVRDTLETMDGAHIAGDQNLGPLYTQMSEALDPELQVEFRTKQIPDARAYVGVDGWVEMWRHWLSVWDEYSIASLNYAAIGDHVVADVVHRGLGRGSGLEVELPQSQVWTFRDGVVIACRMYDTRDEALRATETAA
jgi:SnoaL-like domain